MSVKEWIVDHAWALILVLAMVLAFIGFYFVFQLQVSEESLGIFGFFKKLTDLLGIV